MEKRTPHYSLAEIKALVAERGALAFTRTAMDNGHAMGLIVQDMIEVVCSMTIAYIKVSDPSGRRPVIQFKEK